MLDELERGLGRKRFLTGMYRAYCVHQFLVQAVLHQISTCSGFQRAKHLDVAHVGREHDDLCIRKFVPNGNDGIKAAHLRHLQIHQSNVGPMGTEALQGLPPVGRFGHQTHIWLSVQKCGNSLADDMMVVDDENTDGFRFGHS